MVVGAGSGVAASYFCDCPKLDFIQSRGIAQRVS
jgi:hypothetical protein